MNTHDKGDREGTHIIFRFAEQKPKTGVWLVSSKYGGDIGVIKWFPRWRKYSFFPDDKTIYEEVCMREISGFIEELTKEHKRTHDKGE